MHYHIILTEKCNSQCRYCYEKSLKEFDNKLNKKFKFDFSSPTTSEIDTEKLKKFLKKDKESYLIFYGGEPLLEIEKIKKIIDSCSNVVKGFRMQTNAKLLNEIPINYLNKINKILVSIDGDKEITDFNRGQGTYDRVIENLNNIRKQGYNGEIIARMTISPEFPDIEKQVKFLIERGFNSVHWQIDAGFYESDFNEKKFKEFVEEYNKSISKLINFWFNEIKKGRVIKIYPFIGILESILNNKKTKLRCGAGHSGYAITTNGKIVACPIMNCIKDFEAGNLNSNPRELKKFEISGKCLSCSEKDLCGGRCLYWNKSQLWPKKGDELICNTIKYLIRELKDKAPEVEKLIFKKVISKKDFKYERYFGPEIIP